VRIDRTGDRVRVWDNDGTEYSADRVILTTPIKILQEERIAFTPPLPSATQSAIDSVYVPPGIKAFLRFRERFYPDMLLADGLSQDKLYYDAAFRKGVQDNVLALFWVAEAARQFTDLDDDGVIRAILSALDGWFDGQASANLLDAHVMNWSNHPFVRGAYSFDYAGDAAETVRTLRQPIDGKLYLAGEACSVDNTATVPGAMQSAYDAVAAVLVS